MIEVSMRRTLVALATTAALLPAAPALAQTAAPTATPTASVSPVPAPAPAAPRIEVDRTLIDFGQTTTLVVFGRVGATVQLFGNGRVVRTAVLELTEQDAIGIAVFPLQPGDRTLFYATVDGRQTASVTVEVRRTVTIGIQQPTRGVYVFSGQVARAEAGLQVTIARLDSGTRRVTGVASTRTDAAGRYTIRTSLPVGFAGYYALTGVTSTGALQPGRSRLYGLIVNTRPGTTTPPPSTSQGLTLGVRRAGNSYAFEGVLTPARGGVPVTLAQIVNGRLQGLAGGVTEANGRYVITIQPPPGTYQFTALTANARSRNYGLVVPTPAPGTSCSATARRTSYEDSARCFFQAFVRNDRRLAGNYATPAAVAEFLSWRGAGTPGWSWEGCGEPTVLTPSSGISCAYYDPMPGEVHGVLIEFGMARDFRVEAVGTVG